MTDLSKQRGSTFIGIVVLFIVIFFLAAIVSGVIQMLDRQPAETVTPGAEISISVQTATTPIHEKYFGKALDTLRKGKDGNSTFISGEGDRIEMAGINLAPEDSVGVKIIAYFWPVKMIRVEPKNSNAQIYTYSQAPAEYQNLWDTLYAQASEVGEEHKSWFVPQLYTGEDILSTAKYEARIEELEVAIKGLETVVASEIAETNSLTAALELLKVELAETMHQRDSYKAYVDKMLAQAPSFED